MALFNDVPVLMRSLLKTGPGMHSEDGGRESWPDTALPCILCEICSGGSRGPLCVLRHIVDILRSFCIQLTLASGNK